MKILDKKGFNFLCELEGLRLEAYQDIKGIWTIGVGNTYYEDNTPVKQGDIITKERAYELFENIAKGFEKTINDNVKSEINQNQFIALFCFCWNVGKAGFQNSTLLRVVNKNLNDKSSIASAFLLWKGKKNILLSRRNKEIAYYFK